MCPSLCYVELHSAPLDFPSFIRICTLLGVPSFARFWRQEFREFPRPAWAVAAHQPGELPKSSSSKPSEWRDAQQCIPTLWPYLCCVDVSEDGLCNFTIEDCSVDRVPAMQFGTSFLSLSLSLSLSPLVPPTVCTGTPLVGTVVQGHCDANGSYRLELYLQRE